MLVSLKVILFANAAATAAAVRGAPEYAHDTYDYVSASGRFCGYLTYRMSVRD